MEILILLLEITFKFVTLATLIIGAFVLITGCWAYYKCSKDEKEREADNDD